MAEEPIDHTIFFALNTDSVPERLENQAQRVLNMVPVSDTNVRPRNGTDLIQTYRPVINGRCDISDGLPDDINQATLVISTASDYASSNQLLTTIEGLARFRPARTADLYDEINGSNLGPNIYIAFQPNSEGDAGTGVYDFLLGIYTAYVDGAHAARVYLATAYLRPCIVIDDRLDPATANYRKGLAYSLFSNPGISELFGEAFNITTQEEIIDPYFEFFLELLSSNPVLSGVCPLSSGFTGYATWFEGDGIYIVQNGKWDNATTVDGPFTGQGTVQFRIFEPGALETIMDVSPLSKSLTNTLLFAASSDGGAHQIQMIQQVLGTPIGGSTPTEFDVVFETEYVMGDWSGWSDSPLGASDVQQIPLSSQVNAGVVIALLGNVQSSLIHKVIAQPRLAMVAGPGQSQTNIFGIAVQPFGIMNSHDDNDNYNAHGMIVDQFGYVYTIGNGDWVRDQPNYLINKFAPWDFDNVWAAVIHNGNGLGDYYTDPLDSHICNIMCDGTYIMVIDHDPEKDRLFVYDLNLTFISKHTLVDDVWVSPTASTLGGTVAQSINGVTSIPWLNPSRAINAAAPYATVLISNVSSASPSYFIDITNFGFDIPANSTILGVLATITRYSSSTTALDDTVQLVVGGLGTGDNKSLLTALPTVVDSTNTYGSLTDIWGTTIGVDDVNASNFGLRYACKINGVGSDTVNLGSVHLQVAYLSPLRVVCNKYSTRFFADNY